MSTDKIYVYHHNDHDGIVAAGIVYKRYKNPVNKHKIIFNMIDYNVLLNFDHIDFEKGDKVFFLDYSFSNKENIEAFKKLLGRRIHENDVVWIDHHKTSIGGELNNLYRIPGIRRVGLCGAAWTYFYLYFEYFHELDLESRDDIPEFFHNSKVPTFLKYIDDYDCWKHMYPATNDFHYGLTISHPTDDIINILLSTSEDFSSVRMNYITDIIKQGEEIQKFLKFENKEYHVDMYGFETTLPLLHKNGVYRVFCMNRKGNSLMFGDKIDEYDAVIPFYYNGERWTYSMFSNKEYVDCSAVAKAYGGGGHKGAAGWTSDKLIF